MFLKFRENTLLANIAKLSSGTFIAQLIPLALTPVLTRMFTPQEFGVLALFASMATFISIVVTWGLEYAIILPKHEGRAYNLFVLSLAVISINTVIVCLLLALFAPFVSVFIYSVDTVYIIIFLACSIFLQGLFRTLNQYSIRLRKFNSIAYSTVLRSVFTNTMHVLSGFLSFGSLGLIGGNIVGHITASASIALGNQKILADYKKYFNPASWRRLLGRYKAFPLHKMPSELMNNFSVQIPVYLLNAFFSKTEVGYYSLPQRILTLPTALIGASISQVYLKEVADCRNDSQKLGSLLSNVFNKLMLVGIVPFSILAFWSDYIFEYVFGSEWIIAGEYAQIISPWLFLVFCVSPLSLIFTIREKQKEGFICNALLLCFRLVLLLIGGLCFRDATITVIFYGIGGLVFWIFYSVYVLKLSFVQWSAVSKSIIIAFVVIVLAGISRYLFDLLL